MITLDKGLAEYINGCRGSLAAIETELIGIEKRGTAIDSEQIDRAVRAVHSIKTGARVFELARIGDLAQRAENMLASIRSREMVPTPERVGVLLRATDRLHELIENPGTSNQADIGEIMAALAGDCLAPAGTNPAATVAQADQGGRQMRVLLVEDDASSRLLLQTFLSRYGDCHVALNGREAVEAFRSACARGQRYDLICMDIMMPEMNGREAVRHVRDLEESQGTTWDCRVKIIMTTTVDEIGEVMRCFRELCDAYLTKPIDLAKLLNHIKSFELVQ